MIRDIALVSVLHEILVIAVGDENVVLREALGALDGRYPDWYVLLTFEDGTQLALVTNESNFLFYGGPWQVTIDEQMYMQYSPDFLIAVLELVEALQLPEGFPSVIYMGVGGYFEREFIYLAFSR